jgi:colanic acid biosynthesis protein WcaH
MLNNKQFKTLIESAPLISIDLIVKNKKGEILLGKRVNRPAKNHWFVPDGRIFKNESMDDAFERITQNELGIRLTRNESVFKGLYEHFYGDNVFKTKRQKNEGEA